MIGTIRTKEEDKNWDEREYIDLSDFGKVQAQDSKAGLIIDYFLYGKLPLDDEKFVEENRKGCIMESGQLYKVEHRYGKLKQCLWIPDSRIEQILNEFHGSYTWWTLWFRENIEQS